MKKLLTALLTLVMILSVLGCAKAKSDTPAPAADQPAATEQPASAADQPAAATADAAQAPATK